MMFFVSPRNIHSAGALLAALTVCAGTAGAEPIGRPSPEVLAIPYETLTQDQLMERRYPQPVKVGRLIGMPVYDHMDRTLGRIHQVVRGADGRIKLIVPFGGWFGWGDRPVAVPIETVAILGSHVNALEFTREHFEKATYWTPGRDTALAPDDTIRIGLSRR